MKFTALNNVTFPKHLNFPVITVPVYPFCCRENPIYMRIYALPIGVDNGRTGNGNLIYKCVDKCELIMLTKFDYKFEFLHPTQLDDINALDGREFTFNEKGEYGMVDFAVPKKIRNRNKYIADLGVIQWESLAYSTWYDDCGDPETYQWNPETDKVRKQTNNGWSEWTSDYEIDPEDYSVNFDLVEPECDDFDDLPF